MPIEPDDPPRKHYGLKAREFENLNAAGKTPEKSVEHDVFAMLQQNREVEKNLGQDSLVIPPKRKSRRKRDYWIVLPAGNLLIIGLMAIGQLNAVSLIFGLSGLIFFTLSLTWVMWFVLDDY